MLTAASYPQHLAARDKKRNSHTKWDPKPRAEMAQIVKNAKPAGKSVLWNSKMVDEYEGLPVDGGDAMVKGAVESPPELGLGISVLGDTVYSTAAAPSATANPLGMASVGPMFTATSGPVPSALAFPSLLLNPTPSWNVTVPPLHPCVAVHTPALAMA